MNKEASNESTAAEIFYNKKELEKSCLDAAISKVPCLQKYKLVGDKSNERPDFILKKNNKFIGIEHFYIDMLYIDKRKHTGLGRYTYNDIRNLYKKYHEKVIQNTFDFQNSKNVCSELENIFSKLIDVQNDFNYDFFIKEWDRTFNNHYKNRYDYKKENNLDKLGFLIEIRRCFPTLYICNNNNTTINLDSKGIPITKDIAQYLNKLDDGVDFFIVVVKGIIGDFVNVEFYDKNKPAKAKYDNFSLSKMHIKPKINVEQ